MCGICAAHPGDTENESTTWSSVHGVTVTEMRRFVRLEQAKVAESNEIGSLLEPLFDEIIEVTSICRQPS